MPLLPGEVGRFVHASPARSRNTAAQRHRGRWLIFPQTLEGSLANHAGGRPAGKLDLRDQFRPDPVDVGSGSRKRGSRDGHRR
jgi:hypothetical protein